MSYFAKVLTGAQIDSVFVDSEVTYIMLTNGTQITIRGTVVVQPKHTSAPAAGLIPEPHF
jgi:hypothetical protein